MRIKLDDIAWRIPEGHKLRLAISTSYWPMMWPSPEPVTLTVYAGASTVHIPVRRPIANEIAPVLPAAEAAEPVKLKELDKPWHKRKVTRDETLRETRLEIVDDFGSYRIESHGLINHGCGRELHSIRDGDPLSAKMETHWTEEMQRGAWRVRTETRSRLTCSKTHWMVWGQLEAFEGDYTVFSREWNKEIERKLN
jgi:hypothetical protein